MKKLIIFFLLFVNLFSYVYKINKGWNLIGIHSNLKIKDLGNIYKIIWIYKNGEWYVYSPDENILNVIKEKKFNILNDLNFSNGAWIYSTKNFVFVTDFIDNDKILYKKGWELVSLPKEGNISNKVFNNSDIQYVWKFKDNNWYGYSTNEKINNLISQKYNLLKNVKDNEGFWINAKNDGSIDIGKNYYAYFYFIENNRILPLQYQLIKDKFQTIGYTDDNGKIFINSPETVMLNDNDYNSLPIVMNNANYNYVAFVSKKDVNESEIYSDVFDIGNFRIGDTLTFISAKIPPKVFLSFDKNFGFIVKKFSTNEDLTIAVIPKEENNESILGAMEIKLEDSLGNEVTQQEAGFNGEFKIYMKSKKINDDVVIMKKTGDNLDYVCDTYYLNGKYYSKKNLANLGEFLFVKTPRLYIHKLHFNVNKAIVIDSNLNSYIIFKNGEFKSTNKEENITVFADDFKSKRLSVGKDTNITLEPKNYFNKCIIFKDLITDTTLNNLNIKVHYGNEILNLEIKNGESCFVTDNNSSVMNIDDINYSIVDNTVYFMPEYLKLKTNAVSYSNLHEANFTYFVYNTTANSFIYNLDKNKSLKLGNYVFDSINKNILADIGDNIYKINNGKIEKANFSKDDFLVNIGNFIFSPVASKDYLFFPTTTAKIVLTDLNGNNAYVSPIYLKTYDNNKSNDLVSLYDINDSSMYAVINEGLIYLVNKNNQTSKLIKTTSSLNSYKITYDSGNLYIAGDKIYKINDENVSEYMNIKAERIFKKGKYFIADNKVYINGKYSYSFEGMPVNAFLIKDNLIIVTENSIYKNNKKLISFNQKIINSSLKNGYFLIEFKNGKVIVFK